jgi:hypothetical protein
MISQALERGHLPPSERQSTDILQRSRHVILFSRNLKMNTDHLSVVSGSGITIPRLIGSCVYLASKELSIPLLSWKLTVNHFGY